MPGLNRRHLLAAPFALASAGRAKPAAPMLPLPDVVDHSALLGPARDQGARFTCAYFAVTAALEALHARQTGMPVSLSEQYLADIVNGGKPRPADESVDLLTVMSAAIDHGMVPASARPYQPNQPKGQLVQPPDAALQALAWRPGNLDLITMTYPVDIDRIQRALLRRPLIVGLALPADAAGWHDDGLVQPVPGLVPHGIAAREKFPNHFVAFTGYDQRRQMFFFRNCWGPGWGNNGYGRISFESMQSNWLADMPWYFFLETRRNRAVAGAI